MFELCLGLALVLALYARTWSYNNLIDDNVPMKGYLYVVPDRAPEPQFFQQKSRRTARLWAITVHLLNIAMVYLLLGGKAALLFAVFPISANNVAWVTGSYYSTTTFLTLSALYFLKLGGLFAAGAAMISFAAALNSTVACISFPFIAAFASPFGWTMFFPLVMFLVGKRFRTGVKIREKLFDVPGAVKDEITPGRFVVAIKVIARYVFTALVPIRLRFFHEVGKAFLINAPERERLMKVDGEFFAGLALIGSFLGLGYVTGNLFWALWFCVLLGAFCQIKILGQFFAERYIYPASVGVVAILSCLPDPAYWMLVGMYVIMTHNHIPVFKNNRELYLHGTKVDPDGVYNYLNLSDWYLKAEQDLNQAYVYIQKVLQLAPNNWVGHMNLSAFFIYANDPVRAKQAIETAKQCAQGATTPQLLHMIDMQLEICENMIEGAKSAQ